MPNFFIRRPIVAIVISILMLMLGTIVITQVCRLSSIPFLPRRTSA